MVRNSVQLLTVREVSAALTVSRATIYSLMERGELIRVWIGSSLRVPTESLDAYVARRSGIPNPRTLRRVSDGPTGD